MKYAVYTVIVEDSEEMDMAVMTRIGIEAGERIAGDLEWEEASELLQEAELLRP